MKKIGFLVAAAAMLVASAMPASAQLFNWSGFYYGASAGYNMHWSKFWDQDSWAGGGVSREHVDGFIFGLNTGRNIQSGNYVYGYEGDISYSTAKGTMVFNQGFDPLEIQARFIGTLRLRSGVAQDRTLYYLTGGLALSNTHVTINTGVGTWKSNFNYGGALGAGIEQALANNPNWTWRVEALWLLFVRQNMDDGVSGYNVKLQNSDLIIRVGLNVKN